GYQPIRNTRRQVAPQLGVPTISPPSRNHVVTFCQLLEESRDVVRVVLKIAVEANNDVTRCMVDPGHHRGGLTEVTPKAYDLKAGIFASQLPQRCLSRIGASVIDEDHLVTSFDCAQSVAQSLAQQMDVVLLVVNWNNN